MLETFKESAAEPTLELPHLEAPKGSPRLLILQFVPLLGAARSCVKGLSEAAWRAEEGKVDPAAFIGCAKARIGVAVQVEQDALLISKLVGIACRATVYAELRYALKHDVFNATQRVAVRDMLERVDRDVLPLKRNLPLECAVLLDLLRYAADSSRPPVRNVEELFGPTLELIQTIRAGGVETAKISTDVLAYYKQVSTMFKIPCTWEQRQRISALAESASKTDLLVAGLLADMGIAYELAARGRTLRRGVRPLYEIHVFHDTKGKWFAGLADLGNKVVKRFGVDPFGHGDFVYRLVDRQPLLYSRGRNGQDDGGEHAEWGKLSDEPTATDYVIWPVQ
jgi:hypothetical protein